MIYRPRFARVSGAFNPASAVGYIRPVCPRRTHVSPYRSLGRLGDGGSIVDDRMIGDA
jgi:hypothetical protein